MATLSKELQEYADAHAVRKAQPPTERLPQIICMDAPPEAPLPKATGKRLSRLTNTSKVKQAALDFAKQHRAKAFTRVSQSFLDAIEAEVRLLIQRRVKLQPSVGKTLT